MSSTFTIRLLRPSLTFTTAVLLCTSAFAGDIYTSTNPLIDSSIQKVCPEQLSSGTDFTCVLHDNGQISCFGWNQAGQTHAPTSKVWMDLSAGHDFACAVDDEGSLQCWGQIWALDLPSVQQNEQWVGTPGEQTYIDVAAGYDHVCALTWDGAIHCWGNDTDGKVSDAPTGTGYAAITSGHYHSCAIDRNGDITCWGSNAMNQTDLSVPHPPRSRLGPFTQISAGSAHTCAVGKGVHCWGDAAAIGQLGVSYSTTNVHLSASRYTQCAIQNTGTGGCNGPTLGATGSKPWPAPKNLKQLSAGTYHACASVNGRVDCGGHTDRLGRYAPPAGTACHTAAVSTKP